jgi:hypothetical protein
MNHLKQFSSQLMANKIEFRAFGFFSKIGRKSRENLKVGSRRQ